MPYFPISPVKSQHLPTSFYIHLTHMHEALASASGIGAPTQRIPLSILDDLLERAIVNPSQQPSAALSSPIRDTGRLIFIHLQCWEVLPFCRFQRQRCIKFLCPKDPDFYTPLVLKTAKGQHLPALEVFSKSVSQIPPYLAQYLFKMLSAAHCERVPPLFMGGEVTGS